MADFCMQCSVQLGVPKGWSDFAGLSIWNEEGFSETSTVGVLCEGCGPTIVDRDGVCHDGSHRDCVTLREEVREP